jgi:phospholipase/carboxylesterase
MASNALILQSPAGPAAQLILLFHGLGTNAQSMRMAGAGLAAAFPQAMVVAVDAPLPGQAQESFQWFAATQDGPQSDEQAAAEQAMPAFAACVAQWQQHSGVGPEATALVGFSQGATMALESTKLPDALASRVVAIAGRFITLPETDAYAGTIHFLHGKDDTVVPYKHAVMAAHHLKDLGGDITAEVRPNIGHEIHAEFIALMAEKLSTHISHRIWTLAMQAQQAQDAKP